MTEENKIRLQVVIINYKTPDLIFGALKSLENEIDHQSDRVVVVDNFSDDGSDEKIAQMIEENGWGVWASLIRSPVNGGFSAGNNIGIKSAQADYYLLLNSDAYVSPGAIEKMVRKLEECKEVGILGPAITWENGDIQTSCFNYARPLGEMVSTAHTGPITKLLAIFGAKEIAVQNAKNEMRPEWISFSCVMIRREVFDQVGLMDEGYFMYYEDMDYSRMARKKGWDILYYSDAAVVHLNKGHSNNKLHRYPGYVYRSRSRYFIKFYGRVGLLLANLFWIKGWVIARIRNIFRRDKKPSRPNAFGDIWKGFW